MNTTLPSALILQALAQGYHYGFDIIDVTGLPSGTVYPALRRLEREGLLASEWEDMKEAHAQLRPARRYYAINAEGEAALEQARKKYRVLANLAPAGKPRRSHA
jgi:DNA-binding PadR family transcriptional regulator